MLDGERVPCGHDQVGKDQDQVLVEGPGGKAGANCLFLLSSSQLLPGRNAERGWGGNAKSCSLCCRLHIYLWCLQSWVLPIILQQYKYYEDQTKFVPQPFLAMGCNLRPLLEAHVSHSIVGVPTDAVTEVTYIFTVHLLFGEETALSLLSCDSSGAANCTTPTLGHSNQSKGKHMT